MSLIKKIQNFRTSSFVFSAAVLILALGTAISENTDETRPTHKYQGKNALEIIDNTDDFSEDPKGQSTPLPPTRNASITQKYDEVIFDDSTLQNIVAVEIKFPSDTNFFINGNYNLDPNGNINIPIIGSVKIKGQNSEDVAKLIENSFADYVNYPSVKIKLLMRVALLGGFLNPGLYYTYPTTPLWDVVAQAGGPIREDGFKKMRWWRGEEVYMKDLNSVIRSGRTLKDLNFHSGDVITVTQLPKLGFWGALRTEVLPFILMLGSVATLYITWLTFDSVNNQN